MNPVLYSKPSQRISETLPGYVGSVGDVVVSERLKTSTPWDPIRWKGWNSGLNAPSLGTGAGAAGVARAYEQSAWQNNDKYPVSVGWTKQTVKAPDMSVTPVESPTPHLNWRRTGASVFNARRTGNIFSPMPGPYGPLPGDVPRGVAVEPILLETARVGVNPLVGGDRFIDGRIVSMISNQASEGFMSPSMQRGRRLGL